MGLIECSSEFEVAWKAADPVHNCEKTNPYAVTDTDLSLERTAPQTNQDSFIKAGSQNGENVLSSSPAILHLPLHCQTQIHGRASWDMNGSPQGSVLGVNSAELNTKQERSSPTVEERNGMVVIRSTDRVVFSDHTDTQITSDSSWPSSASLCLSVTEKKHMFSRVPLAFSGLSNKGEACSSEAKEGVEEARELLSPGEKRAPTTKGSSVGWFSSGPHDAPPNRKREDVDGFVKAERPDGEREDQIIEVDGWCHLPRFPIKSPGAADKAMQTCWGLPENEVRIWGAQILLALESLHQQGILCRDLNPRNVLLTSNGKVSLTFFSQWSEVQSEISSKAMEQMYCAPEIGGVSRITESCDWWSLGALLFELLTGMPLWQLHPAGIHSHTQLLIPDHLSTAAASLLTELLQFDAGYRLGSGGGGVSDIKCHPFFNGVSWKALSC